MKTYIKILLLLSFIIYNPLLAQIKLDLNNKIGLNIPQERIDVLLNSDLFLTGESIYYKVFCFNEKTNRYSTLSKLIYVELVGIDNNIVFKHKLKLENGIAYGDFLLPTDVLTGNYKIIAYTNWSKNENSFEEKDVYIINPYVRNKQIITNIKGVVDTVMIKINDTIKINPRAKQISNIISVTKNVYNKREKVIVNISNKTSAGNYSLSVRKVDSVSILKKENPLKESNKSTFKNDIMYLPELRGEIISGKIEPIKANSIENKVIALSMIGNDYIFKTVKTNSFGQFFFSINEDYSTLSEAIVQVYEPNRLDYKVSIDEKKIHDYDFLFFSDIKLSPNINDWLITESINNQIENAYHEVKKDNVVKLNDLALPFYDSSKVKTYVLDDYTRFKTIKETFIEIINGASFRKSNGMYNFYVSDNVDNVIDTNLNNTINALVLVDGFLIQDYDNILEYKAINIESIDVVMGNYLYGPKIYKGIIAMKTKKGDFKVSSKSSFYKSFEINKIFNKKDYYTANYSKSNNNRIPDFRTQLLWNPNIVIRDNNQDNDMQVEFFTSDDSGRYKIELLGFSNSGKYVKDIIYFSVPK